MASSQPYSGSTSLCSHTRPPNKDHTCPHPYHANYSEDNLPPLVFQLEPRWEQQALPAIPPLVEKGRVVKDSEGMDIRDFAFLPRYISARPAGWLLEYWMRTDHRLTYRDIKARMVGGRRDKPLDNTLNMRRERDVRTPLALSCWSVRRSNSARVSRIDVERVERWSLDQIHHNTTMEIEYRIDMSTGRFHPKRLMSKPLNPNTPPRFYPLNHFLGDDNPHTPSRRLQEVIQTYHRLARRARELRLRSWRLLPDEELPTAWISHRDNARAASAVLHGRN
ncbi:hypothetical protein BDV59DRAFT_204658 [Aspergillus ambiguus]|uniref:uncharacterized protein n=1 Tax=Aspergillus ambiguus TaxID=176160 RepID=UPI003CCE4E9F